MHFHRSSRAQQITFKAKTRNIKFYAFSKRELEMQFISFQLGFVALFCTNKGFVFFRGGWYSMKKKKKKPRFSRNRFIILEANSVKCRFQSQSSIVQRKKRTPQLDISCSFIAWLDSIHTCATCSKGAISHVLYGTCLFCAVELGSRSDDLGSPSIRICHLVIKLKPEGDLTVSIFFVSLTERFMKEIIQKTIANLWLIVYYISSFLEKESTGFSWLFDIPRIPFELLNVSTGLNAFQGLGNAHNRGLPEADLTHAVRLGKRPAPRSV